MNTTQATPAARQPQALLSARTRLATALAVTGFVAAAWLGAGHDSHRAVELSALAMAAQPTYVTLEPVVIVGQRQHVDETAVAGVPSGRNTL